MSVNTYKWTNQDRQKLWGQVRCRGLKDVKSCIRGHCLLIHSDIFAVKCIV